MHKMELISRNNRAISVHSTVGTEFRVRLPEILSSVLTFNFHSVLGLLIFGPGGFTISFSLSKSFVFILHSFHVLVFLQSGFIFEHSSHAGNGVGLLSISLFFCAVSIRLITVFTVLLIAPGLLSFGINSHTLVVY